jgi:hypothetical protein
MLYKSPPSKLNALALILLLPGCIWGSVHYDWTLKKEVIKNIEPGKTTRMNILQWLGPPAILAEQGGVTLLPTLDPDPEKMRKVDSKVFFKYFLEGHAISEQHVVYYYFNEWEKINGVSIPIGNTLLSLPLTSTDLQFSELWVLVNRKTGQVEDFVFLEREEK